MNSTYAPSDVTPKQITFLNALLAEASRLLDQRDAATGCEWTEARRAVADVVRKVDTMTRREASAAIQDAKDNNQLLRDELKSLGAPDEPTLSEPQYVTEVGIYRVGDRIFKVLPSRSSDRHYAKELTGFHWEDRLPVADEDGTPLRFVYAKGAMRGIRPEHRVSLEFEKSFGQLTGTCIDCGKLLTDRRSIDYGKGPVCSDNYTR